jgi:co-chaperonin GroES (HSP10)
MVVSAGAGRAGVAMSVKENQIVYYKKDDALPFTLEGEQFVILVERDVWMIN